jgi:hypothetical protein
MTDETEERVAVSSRQGRRQPETTGDVAGISAIQVGLLLLMIFANLLVLWMLWGIVSAA